MQAQLVPNDSPTISTKTQLATRIQILEANLKQIQEINTPGYHRA
jgi:hypothetical protein